MKNTLTRISLLLIGWLALFSVAQPDMAREAFAQERATSPAAIESARARWDALSPTEQAQLKRRFEQLQKLDSQQRSKLEKRTKRHQQLEQRVLGQLSDQESVRLKGLPKNQRREVIDQLVEQERRDKGRRIESKLPNAMREWMKNASPEERQEKLESFKADTRTRISSRVVEDFAKALGYGESEIRRLERLPMQERMATVMRLRKKLTAQELQEYGLPRGLTQEGWSKLEALPPEEFLREVWRLQNRGVLTDVFNSWSSQRQGSRESGREFIREIRQALRVQPGELLELSGLAPAERRKQIAHRRGAQSLEVLRKYEIFPPERLDALEAMEDETLLEEVRAYMDNRMRERASRQEARH